MSGTAVGVFAGGENTSAQDSIDEYNYTDQTIEAMSDTLTTATERSCGVETV